MREKFEQRHDVALSPQGERRIGKQASTITPNQQMQKRKNTKRVCVYNSYRCAVNFGDGESRYAKTKSPGQARRS
ncbi:MAG: hypothetical protein JSR61_14540 [Proteobacteria bacterium]|nr:hypothetical protein [Pseudomonadota bacterium]